MKNIGEIIEAYRLDWHVVDGLYIQEVQSLTESDILDILENAQGRDIIIKENWEDDNRFDGQSWKYDGQKDPNFDMSVYMK